ncbi:MAG: PorT family protein [Bacteroidales bacterium]|nr:PorT family protein [Bacteroidales bacterium]
MVRRHPACEGGPQASCLRKWYAGILPAVFFIFFHLHPLNAQIGNLGQFDSRLLHYGIQVGYTQSKFDLAFSQDDSLRQSLQGTTSYYAPGFHIAVIGDMRLGRWFNLRLLPGVTLVTRTVAYSWEEGYLASHYLAERSRNVESVYGDIPIEIKFRAVRWNNFRPYVTAGASYGFDFASLRKNRNQTNQSIIRLQPHDIRYSMGVGFDVFLRYVKFAIELKMNFGLLDLKVEDPDVYIRAFDNLKSRTFMLSFTFEG